LTSTRSEVRVFYDPQLTGAHSAFFFASRRPYATIAANRHRELETVQAAMSAEIRDAVRTFILNNILRRPNYKLGDDDSLIKGGLMDSFSLVEVQLFIEETYGFRPDDVDMTVENMDTVRMIADYVAAHR
jgi:acyl carrier protein